MQVATGTCEVVPVGGAHGHIAVAHSFGVELPGSALLKGYERRSEALFKVGCCAPFM